MLYETISLSDINPKVSLTTYVFDNCGDLKVEPRRAVIVCPGGGYKFLSNREAEPIVARFLGEGFNVFLLRYSVTPDTKYYQPLIEAARAIAHVRRNAERYHVDPKKIFICGFSAGGHLAASAGIHWNHPVLQEEFKDEEEGINRPDGMILSYPVITAGEHAHCGSIKNLTCIENYGEKETLEWSLELNVDESTPPAFIWHTVPDKVVPVQNALLLANALTNKGVPYELHIYPYGPHGLSLATEETANSDPNKLNPHTQSWAELAVKWIKLQ